MQRAVERGPARPCPGDGGEPPADVLQREGVVDSLNIGLNTGDDTGDVRANRALLAGALGLEAAALATVYQVHGPALLVMEAGRPAPGVQGRPLAAADGLVTGAPRVGVAVGAADCVPVLLADPQARVVGAVHAGWRGIARGVVETAVAALARAGDDPARFFSARRDRRTGRQAGVIVAW